MLCESTARIQVLEAKGRTWKIEKFEKNGVQDKVAYAFEMKRQS
jgi:hypothetical protein